MKSVLMIAYHFPPEGASSGVHRTLSFSRYLEHYQWRPIVLSAHPRAYETTRTDQLEDLPDDMIVHRAFALDTRRHLSIFGRYPIYAALPDRWVTWWLGAVLAGWRMIRKYRPQALWTTYPIATAHLIGHSLHQLTGLPWIADFRDPMTVSDFPEHPLQWRAHDRIERKALSSATRSVFTTPGVVRSLGERYPGVAASRFSVIPNGYDEESFEQAARTMDSALPHDASRTLFLLHSGVLYREDRDPSHFYKALGRLSRAGKLKPANVRIVFRNCGHVAHHERLIEQAGVGDFVSLAPRLPYKDALQEMMAADGLLLFQSSACNHQVPAKIYEYLRARKPILALTDPRGDTAQVLRDAGTGAIVPLDDEVRIAEELTRYLDAIRAGAAPVATDEEIRRHSRRGRTEALAALLEESVREGAH